MLSSVKNIERDVQDRTDERRDLNSAIDAGGTLEEMVPANCTSNKSLGTC